MSPSSSLLRPFRFSRCGRQPKRREREVFERRHRSRSREAALLDPDRSSPDEEILDFTTGDKEFWIINGAHNLCYVHPAQAGIRSNLNLITASGHVYSFLLTEISSESGTEPDLKIFIEPKETSGFAAKTGLAGYVTAGEAKPTRKNSPPTPGRDDRANSGC